MIDPKTFFDVLNNEEISFFAGIPDSLLKNFCAYITDHTNSKNHIIAANEGNAFAIGIGYHLATNKIPLIYMQNSGLGNIVNPLLSLADPEVYSFPSLLMIGWRGEPSTKDEPQHQKQGRVTLELLTAMEIPYQIISSEMNDEGIIKVIQKAILVAKTNDAPYALMIKKGAFSNYQLQTNVESELPLLREDAIKIVVDQLDDNDVVVSTTGVASRELFEYREMLGHGHKRDFLTVGGMGHASQIALGIALHKPDRLVYCFDGDGALLMHLGALAINGSLQCSNLVHIIFNNGAHDSVGGQPTVALEINIPQIAKAVGYNNVFQAETEAEIIDFFQDTGRSGSLTLLEIKVKKGFRKNFLCSQYPY